MFLRLVTVEPFGTDGTGETVTELWRGPLKRDRWFHHDFVADLPRDMRLGVLSGAKQLRIELSLDAIDGVDLRPL